MITVAIAVRDTVAARQYRALLTDFGIDAHFASDIPTLIRLVKGRPIDVVIFDLARNALSVNSWLVEVGRDQDLALAPVLWIGAGILPEMRRVVEEYRPGMYLAKLPGLDGFKDAVNRLIGRVPPAPAANASSSSEPIDEPAWTPVEDNIEDALSIFADSGKARPVSSRLAQPSRPAETIPFPSAGPAPHATNPVPATSGKAQTPAPTVPPKPGSGSMSQQDLDALAERVSGRLAADILSRMDREELRRLVELALSEAPLEVS